MMALLRLAALLVLMTHPAAADPLAQMDGVWRGSGWARETPASPKETIRCQITNSYDQGRMTLTLEGRCVVPGRRLTVSGRLVGTQGSDRITGRWANPDGIGGAQISGHQRDRIVAFSFAVTDPVTGRDVAQNVEWRVSEGALRLRSTDRTNTDIMMSDVSFSE